MARTNYGPGIHACAIAPVNEDGTFTAPYIWLSRKETHDWDPGHERTVKEFEWLTRVGASDIMNGSRLPTCTLRGYVDDKVFYTLLMAATSFTRGPVSYDGQTGTDKFVMGGWINTVIHKLPSINVLILAGGIEPAAVPKVYPWLLSKCKVRSLVVYLDDSTERLRFECQLVGGWGGEQTINLSAVTVDLTAATYSKNQIRAGLLLRNTVNSNATSTWAAAADSAVWAMKRLNSLRLTINNEATPRWTTNDVIGDGTAPPNTSDYLDAGQFDDGNAAATLEVAYWADDDNGDLFTAYQTSREDSWRIQVSRNATHAYNFYLPRVGYVPTRIENTSKRQPIQRATGIAMFDPLDLTNLIAYSLP